MTSVLFVCTANIVRSPIAQVLLQARVAERYPGVSVGSAGLLEPGKPAASGTLWALDLMGIDATEHRSRTIAPELVREADLVLGMERRHIQEAAILVPDAFPRMFTLKELVRRGGAMGARNHESVGAWLVRAHAGRTTRDLLGASDADDVGDPYGGDEYGYEATLRELDQLVSELVDLLWPAL